MVAVSINCSSHITCHSVTGIGTKILVEINGSNDIKLGKLKHSYYFRQSFLYYSIIEIMYNQYFNGKNYMKNQSCTVVAEESQNIKIGNIYSDAQQVIYLKNTKDFESGDIHHFSKPQKEVERIFEIIENNITMHQVSDETQTQALILSKKLKDDYISKNALNFKQSYKEFSSFLSNHTTLYTFVYPIAHNLITSLLN